MIQWTFAQTHYSPAYCHHCGRVVFVKRESDTYTGTKEYKILRCPLCNRTDVEPVSERLANILQRQYKGGGE